MAASTSSAPRIANFRDELLGGGMLRASVMRVSALVAASSFSCSTVLDSIVSSYSRLLTVAPSAPQSGSPGSLPRLDSRSAPGDSVFAPFSTVSRLDDQGAGTCGHARCLYRRV